MKRSEIRENIFKLVFCGEFHSGDELPAQVETYFEEQAEVSEEDRAYMIEKFSHISDRIDEIDEKINSVAKGWKTQRMGKTDLAILRLAVYEMLYDDDVPVKVAINEAVELAKKFGGDDSPSFVNGILAKLAQ
jgi:N utilization substance protein B